MKDLLEIINGGAETVHYVVLNPKDNTVDYISDSLAKLLQNQDYHNKPLRYAVGGAARNQIAITVQSKYSSVRIKLCSMSIVTILINDFSS